MYGFCFQMKSITYFVCIKQSRTKMGLLPHTSIINVIGNLIHAVCVSCSKSCVVGDGASCMSWYTACVIGCICCMCFLIIKHPVLKYNALVTCLMVYNLTESCSVFLTSLCVSVLIWFQSLSTVKLHSAGRKTICGHGSASFS